MKSIKKSIIIIVMTIVCLCQSVIFLPAILEFVGVNTYALADSYGVRHELIEWQSFCFRYVFYIPFVTITAYFLLDLITDISLKQRTAKTKLVYLVISAVLFMTAVCCHDTYWYVEDLYLFL